MPLMLHFAIIAYPLTCSRDLSYSCRQIRVDDEDDEIMVNDQAVERLVIVTQVRT